MNLTQQDLVFILKQIKIAEANSIAHAGGNAKALTDIWVDSQGRTTDSDGNPYTADSISPDGTAAMSSQWNWRRNVGRGSSAAGSYPRRGS